MVTNQKLSYLGIFVELIGGDIVDRENQLDIVLLCLLHESSDFSRARLVK